MPSDETDPMEELSPEEIQALLASLPEPAVSVTYDPDTNLTYVTDDSSDQRIAHSKASNAWTLETVSPDEPSPGAPPALPEGWLDE